MLQWKEDTYPKQHRRIFYEHFLFLYKEPVRTEADHHSAASLECLGNLVCLGRLFQFPEDSTILDHPQFQDKDWIDALVDDILRMRSPLQEWRYRRILGRYQLDDPDMIRRLNLADDLVFILALMQEVHALGNAFLHDYVHLADFEQPRRVLGFNLSTLPDPGDEQLYYAAVEKHRAVQGAAQDTCLALTRELRALRDTLFELIFDGCDKKMQNILTGINLDFGPKSKHARATCLRHELSIARKPYADSLHFQALATYSKYMGQLYTDLGRLSPTFAEYNEVITQLKTKGPSV